MADQNNAKTYPIFTRLKRDEDTYTQLLCNLMIRCPVFQDSMLLLFTQEHRESARLTHTAIRTQVFRKSEGRTDLEITASELMLIVEVKVSPHRGMTEHQVNEQYRKRLDASGKAGKYLVYLVPGNWAHLSAAEAAWRGNKNVENIKSWSVTWQELLYELDRVRGCDPLVYEFGEMLRRDFGSVTFSAEERAFMETKDLTFAISIVLKLQELIKELQARIKKEYPKFTVEEPAGDRDEFGFHIKSRNSASNPLLWIGMWNKVSAPLCVGIENSWEKATPGIQLALSSGSQQLEPHPTGWSTINFSSEFVKGKVPVQQVWKILTPILDRLPPDSK